MSSKVYRLVNLFFKVNVKLSYLVGMKTRTCRHVASKGDNTHFLHYLKNQSIMLLGIFLVCESSAWRFC